MTRLGRAATSVSAATLVSRVLGLFRDALRSALLGARGLSDALDVAFKVPNLLRDLFAEGAFSGAFVPTLAATREREGDAAAFALLDRVLSTLLLYVGLVVGALVWFAPEVVGLIASPAFRARPEIFALTVQLVRLLAPFLLFISLAVAAMGALNVFGRFFLPALSPALQNGVLVCGGVVLVQLAFGRAEAAVPWALLLLAGGAAQFVVQLWPLWRLGWRPRFRPDARLRSPAARQIVRRMLPVAGGLAATHVSILINTRLATEHLGGTSNLYYAFRLVHLPVGLVGVAVGTAVLALASRQAGREDEAALRRTLREGIGLTFALAAPAAAGLAILGVPLARLLFLWGNTEPAEAAAIGVTIRYFAPAVIFYCLVKTVVPLYYARGQVRVPLVASLVAVVANLATALLLHPHLQWRGLALAVGVGQAANLAVLLAVARRRFGPGGPAAAVAFVRIALASGACAVAAWAMLPLLPEGGGAAARAARALIPVAAGGVAYFGAGALLRSREILAVLALRRLDSGSDRP